MADILLNRAIKIIPDDWEQVKIGEIGTTYGGLTNKSKKDFGEGKPYIPFMNIMSNAKVNLNDFDYVNIKEGENQNRAIKGDLFFNTSSETPEEVGMCSVLDRDISELYLNSFCFGFRLIDQNFLNPLFVSYFFRSDFGRKVIFPLAQGMTRHNLSKRYFLELEIPKPRLEEQNKIIDILSTVDEAIENTDAIIEKTHQLKKGLMQKLFIEGIGHTKFKDTKIGRIAEEWDVVKAEKLFSSYSSKNHPNEELLSATQDRGVLPRSMLEGRVMSPQGSLIGYKLVEEGDFVISLRSFQGGIEYSKYRGIVSPAYTVLKCNKDVYKPFYKYLMKKEDFISRLKALTTGIRQGLNIKYSDFKDLLLQVPPISEQKNIAEILSEVDAKIEKEEATKAELEQLKKGLMQVLLTGKVRVKA